MEENQESVYQLITRLTGLYTDEPATVKRLRSRCFQTLLGKTVPPNPRKFKDVDGLDDPFLSILSWSFRLSHEFDMRELGRKLVRCLDRFKDEYKGDADCRDRILRFLFISRDLPSKEDDDRLNLSTLPDISCDLMKFQSVFSTFEMQRHDLTLGEVELRPADEGHVSPTRDQILELASQVEYSSRRTWESYGLSFPDKEKPFMSELGELSSLWVENLQSLYFTHRDANFNVQLRIKPKVELIKQLKYALVGVPFDLFGVGKRGVFFLKPDVLIDGVTRNTLERYCADFSFCAACYRALSDVATPDSYTWQHKRPGYIFKEFCEGVGSYLRFYRVAVFAVPDRTPLLEFHRRTASIRAQIATLASVCKVGPFESSADTVPHGVALLNYLYKRVLELRDEKLRHVVYAVLYPCCQIYLSRFVHRWIFRGSLSDSHDEFFVTSRPKYVATRGRTYWTRGYDVNEDRVPDFLIDLKEDIVRCGKMVNLLELCDPNNPLCSYLRGRIPVAVQCCLTRAKLKKAEATAAEYFLEASSICGPKFDLELLLERERSREEALCAAAAKKRVLVMHRIELEREKTARELLARKQDELAVLRDQYESAVLDKQLKVCREIATDIGQLEAELKIERRREELVGGEARKLIEFYAELSRATEARGLKVERCLSAVRHVSLDADVLERFSSAENILNSPRTSSEESFYSAPGEEASEKRRDDALAVEDAINANDAKGADPNVPKIVENFEFARQIRRKVLEQDFDTRQEIGVATETPAVLTDAQRNKLKVMSSEFGIDVVTRAATPAHLTDAQRNKLKVMSSDFGVDVVTTAATPGELTEAQRNKLKVMWSEFGIDVVTEAKRFAGPLSAAILNRNKVLGSSACFAGLDNETYVNRNIGSAIPKSESLHLDLKRSIETVADGPVPMSVDSTPLSDLPLTVTPLSELPRSVAASTTYCTSETQSDYASVEPCPVDATEAPPPADFSKTVSRDEAENVCTSSVGLFLRESVAVPLMTQKKLVANAILKYFVENVSYLRHLANLRDYFFLQDGEFGRNMTENLFEKLYDASLPAELINCRTLQHLVFGALDSSTRAHDNSKLLSFKIDRLPANFDLGDPDVLDCLSLTYKVDFPLNILLPTDTVSKYDQVFKYLVKVNRVSWVLKRTFLELKVLAKETGEKEIYLMTSPQYRRLHLYRHVMSHFVQTLQNYVVGDVLRPSWALLEKRLAAVTGLDGLYDAHGAYIKDILFRCHLSQKTAAMKAIIQKIFVVVLKFYDYLRSRRWRCSEGIYVHPNFDKLDKIFKNFEEFVAYMFRVVKKLTRTGYQPHLVQFVDALDVNEYYSNRIQPKISLS
ncbi:gamma-tubulin complex component 6 isoform X2 [Cylas formicarius]|uniref:gamma-tubulin complex component 6 isoform X2 n=1 Tax=Cylas formicarius TaxID=197179 RepID=UPI002958A909|nr:gamma-tubulin complex component 6 isoform X2 [Cylas formicarius]